MLSLCLGKQKEVAPGHFICMTSTRGDQPCSQWLLSSLHFLGQAERGGCPSLGESQVAKQAGCGAPWVVPPHLLEATGQQEHLFLL